MKVFVGLSGGVDSSVSALLLKEQGYQVEGVFMRNWNQKSENCQILKDLEDAQKVADTLSIPLHTVDFADNYFDLVFEAFLQDLERGRTPNPDILCNKYIKFDLFYQWCLKQGADKIATGHYAALSSQSLLREARDLTKDQTYFLWSVAPSVFQQVIFPLAQLTKKEVRLLAEQRGLSTFAKSDSTGICFIGPKNYRQFLGNYLVGSPGPIRTTHGDILGTHQGLIFYTLGQRSGLNLGGQAGYSEKPWYVVAKNFDTQELIVSQEKDDLLLISQRLFASQSVWQYPSLPEISTVQYRFRHLQPLQECLLMRSQDTVEVQFKEPQRAVTPGQSIVFYQDGYCLGGAIIDTVLAS